MKILVVEDDRAIARTLQLLFSSCNYAVDVAADGEAGLQMAEAYEYDLILLDVILPRLDGISLCQQLRKAKCKTPILLLTGQEGGHQKAIALNAGADDYVVKPFDAEELVARVQALLRRGQASSQPILTWGQLSIEPSTRKVVYGNHLLSTTPKEYAILELLLRNTQKTLSSRVILDRVWTSLESPGEETVRVHLKQIRQKLTAIGAPKDLIKTKHRVGYQLNPLYASSQLPKTGEQLTAPQIAEMNAVNEELRTTLEQLRSTQAALQQKNQELEIAYRTLEQERQQLQAARDELEQQVAERPATLRESEERLHNVVDYAPVTIWVTDPTGYCTYLNQSWYDFSGQTEETGLGFGWLDALHPDDRENAQSAFLAANERQEAFQLEYRFRRHDGEYRWAIDAASPQFGIDGQFNGYIGSVIDISDRKQAEAKLRESEEKYRSLFDAVDRGFCLLEMLFDANDKAIDYRFIEINKAFERHSGLVNAVGKTNRELVPNLEPQWAEIYGQVAKSGESVRFEADVPSMHRIFDVYAFPSGTPGQNWVAVLFADITDRKQAEEIWRRTAELDAFRVSLSDALRPLTDASDILAIAARTLGESLRATRVIYFEVVSNGEEAIIHRNYTNGVAEMSGKYRFEDFQRNLTADHQAGQTQIVTNIPDNPKYTNTEKANYRDLDIAAHIDVPLVKNDRFVAMLAVHQSTPRQWTETEVKLVEETAERTWAAVERARAEAALRQNEEQTRNILESIHEAFFALDENWQFTYLNPSVEALLDRTLSDLFGKNIWEEYPGLIGSESEHIYTGAMHDRVAGSLTRFYPDRDRWYEVRTYPAPNGISVYFRNVTEQIAAEAVLRESEERYRTLFESIDEGFCTIEILFDRNGTAIDYRFLEVNPRFEQQTGLRQVVGKRVFELVSEHEQYWFEIYGRIAMTGEPLRFENEARALNRWYDVYAYRVGQPEQRRVGVLFRDISDRKRAEQKIREQAALLDITSDAIFVRDLDHRILYWNQGAAQLYGWLATDAIGRIAYQLLQANADQIPEIMQLLLTHGEWQGELHKTTKKGKTVIVEARWTLMRDEANQPKFILSVDTDITQKKQLEAQFYRDRRLESLGTLASGIAHDLNNVLTPILAISQILRSQQSDLSVRSQEMLQLLEDSAKRGTNLIKQILTFTRGTGGERHPVQVVSLVQEIFNIVQQSFPKTIDFRQTICDRSLKLVSANPTYLHQVLMNLCVNARDAMPNGGVLSLSVEHCFVDRALTQTILDAQTGNYVVITIADTGTGISPEVRDRIFDPFFTTKPTGQGTGLGLATVLGIVKEYGGFLQVLSEVDRGTQMKVYLPKIEAIPTPSEPSEKQFDGNGELVLIVDDDVAVQRSTQSLLENYHYTVLSTNDGMEAIALYTQHQNEIRLVILDIMMPTMSGITLIQKLREINPTVKIMAMSGLPVNQGPALAAGANGFLPKPYTPESLLENLQVLIARKK